MKLIDNASEFTKTILFGAGKTGKTRIAGRLAQHYKLKYIDGEKGIKTLLSPDNLDPKYRDNVELFSLPDDGENAVMFTSAYRMLRAKTPTLICDAHGRYDCPDCIKAKAPMTLFSSFVNPNPDEITIIDSGTQLTTSCIAYVTRGKPENYQLQLQDWGQVKMYMEALLSSIQNAKANVIFITHESIEEFDDGKKRIVPVCGSSKFSITVSKYFDNVVYCDMLGKNFRYSSSSGGVPSVVTGSRTNAKTELATDKLYTPLQLLYTKGIT